MSDHKPARHLLRSELARRSGCNAETIRYYEKIGLLPQPPRSSAGYRLYDASHLSRLNFVLRARDLGFSIDDVRSLMSFNDDRSRSCSEVKQLTERHLADVRSKIADLERIEQVLTDTAIQCAGDEAVDCPILEALAAHEIQPSQL